MSVETVYSLGGRVWISLIWDGAQVRTMKMGHDCSQLKHAKYPQTGRETKLS